jgi:hypothetical protein
MCINYCNMGVAHFVIPVHHNSFKFVLGKRINKKQRNSCISCSNSYHTDIHLKNIQLQRKCMASSFRGGNFSSDIGTTSPSLLQYFETDKYCLVGLHHYNYSYNFKTWYTVPKKNITNITFGIPSVLESQTSCATLNPQRTIHLPFSVIYTTLLS